jgi:hypothetical protein
MCDPLSLSIASTVAGVAGTAANSMGAMNAQKKQQREVQAWQQEQKRFRDTEKLRQEEMRSGATKAQQEGLAKLSAAEQGKRQDAEEARLAAYLQGEDQTATTEAGTPLSVADKELTGQQSTGGDEVFQTELAKKINEATAGAKQRMASLAKVSSYGSSFGGLSTVNPLIQQAAGSAIDRQNEFRRGSLGAFGVERAIEPVQVTYTPSPLADIFSSALSFGAQGLGDKFGTGFGGGAASTGFPKPFVSPQVKSFVGPARPVSPKYATTAGLF